MAPRVGSLAVSLLTLCQCLVVAAEVLVAASGSIQNLDNVQQHESAVMRRERENLTKPIHAHQQPVGSHKKLFELIAAGAAEVAAAAAVPVPGLVASHEQLARQPALLQGQQAAAATDPAAPGPAPPAVITGLISAAEAMLNGGERILSGGDATPNEVAAGSTPKPDPAQEDPTAAPLSAPEAAHAAAKDSGLFPWMPDFTFIAIVTFFAECFAGFVLMSVAFLIFCKILEACGVGGQPQGPVERDENGAPVGSDGQPLIAPRPAAKGGSETVRSYKQKREKAGSQRPSVALSTAGSEQGAAANALGSVAASSGGGAAAAAAAGDNAPADNVADNAPADNSVVNAPAVATADAEEAY